MKLVERALASPDPPSRIGAVKWLHSFLLKEGVQTDLGRRALGLMLVSTRDRDPEVRVEAISRLPRAPALAKILVEALVDQSPEVRRVAAISLSWYWRSTAVHGEMLRAASDRDNMVRLAVATTLSKQWDAKIIALMINEAGRDWIWIEDQWISETILPQIQGYKFDVSQLKSLVHLFKTGDAFARHMAQTIIDELKEPQRIGILLGGSGTAPLEIWNILEESDDARAATMALLKALLLYPYGAVGYVTSKGLDALDHRSISETYRAAYSNRPKLESLMKSKELNERAKVILSTLDFACGDRERIAQELETAYPISESLAFDLPKYRDWMTAVDGSLTKALAISDGEMTEMLKEIMAETRANHPRTAGFISTVLEMRMRTISEVPQAPPIPPLPAEELKAVEEPKSVQSVEHLPSLPQGKIAPIPPLSMQLGQEAETKPTLITEEESKIEKSKEHYALGTSLFDKAEYESAISEFQAALATDPKSGRAHLMIGQIKEIQGDRQAAEAAYTASIKVSPELVEARYRLAKVLSARGEVTEPIEHLRQAVLLNPTDWRIRVELDRLLIRDKRFEETLPDLRRIATNKPDMSEAHGFSGIIYYHEGKFPEAQAELETAIRYRPEDVSDLSVFHFFLALVRQERGDETGAIKDLRSALYYDPGNSMARSELHLISGRMLASQGRKAEARSAFRAAIDYDPAYAEIRGALRDLDALSEMGAAERKIGDSTVFEGQ